MNETEIAKRYIEIGWWTLVLTALVTVALAISGGFAYSYWTTVGVSAPTLAFTVGALVALALLVFFAVIAYLAVQTWRDYVWHRQDIERMQAEALLREHEPAPRPETLAVTTGIQITKVGDLIDRRDLEYFCEQIAATKDWTARRWENITLPYGYHITNRDGTPEHPTSYAKLIALFTDCKPPLIVERSDRKTGVLTLADPTLMVKRIVGSTPH